MLERGSFDSPRCNDIRELSTALTCTPPQSLPQMVYFSTTGAIEALGGLLKAGLGAHRAQVNTCWPEIASESLTAYMLVRFQGSALLLWEKMEHEVAFGAGCKLEPVT